MIVNAPMDTLMPIVKSIGRDGEEIIIKAPYKVVIPGGVRHAMLPISSYVILEYSFDTGPFDNIHYEWHGEKIELKKSSCDLRARL